MDSSPLQKGKVPLGGKAGTRKVGMDKSGVHYAR